MPCAEELVKQRDQLCLKKEVTEQGICITGVRPINLQQLCDAVNMDQRRRIKGILKANRCLTRYQKGVPNKADVECIISLKYIGVCIFRL